MVHIGDTKFYEEVKHHLQNCDVIMEEGVNSTSGKLLTASYEYLEKNPKLKLALQEQLNPEEFSGKIIYPDVSGENFEKKLTKIPLRYRLTIFTLAPLYGQYMRWFGSREKILKRAGVEMLESRNNILSEDKTTEQFLDILLTWRDKALMMALDEQIKLPANAGKKIAVVYGAEHMRAVLKFLLLKRKFKVIDSEWLTVIKA